MKVLENKTVKTCKIRKCSRVVALFGPFHTHFYCMETFSAIESTSMETEDEPSFTAEEEVSK